MVGHQAGCGFSYSNLPLHDEDDDGDGDDGDGVDDNGDDSEDDDFDGY